MRGSAVAALTGPPFPSRVNPHAARSGARSAAWAREIGLITSEESAQRLSHANAADLAGRACPNATPERLDLLTDLVTWLFAFDDSCDDDGLGADPGRLSPVVARLLEVLDLLGAAGPAAALTAAGPAGVGLHDLCQRIRVHGHPEFLLRFVGQIRDYLLALLWEATNRRQDRVPGVAEYVQMRRHTGAVYPSFTLTDLAHDALLSAEVRTDSRLAHMDSLAADLVCWCNDVFSYDKERRISKDGHNLTVAIAYEFGQDEEKALLAAAERFNDGLRTYARLEEEVLADGDAEVRRFVTVRRCWIRGTYDWSLRASRYN